MIFKQTHLVSASLVAFGLLANIASASADQWYFYVTNSSTSAIKSILVSETGSNWKSFNIGSGIASGKNVKLIWSSSTNSESCTQLIKATFADGSESEPAKFDFCKDLDTPIIFQ